MLTLKPLALTETKGILDFTEGLEYVENNG
jgi:hypothetical protein